MSRSKVYSPGDRVVVVGGYRDHLIGQLGTVASPAFYSWSYGNVAVSLDFEANPRSSKGYYYFAPIELQLLRNKKEALKEDENMPKLEDYASVAEISFISGSNKEVTYQYACYDPAVKIGDIVVVMSAHHGPGLAQVKALHASTDEELHREIVCVVDFAAYNSRVAQRAKLAALKAQMQARAKKLQDQALYEILAKTDPEMQELLGEYKALQPV